MEFEPATFRFRAALTPDTRNIQDTNHSVDLNSARHEQFQEKKKNPTTELINFISKNFCSRK